MSTPLRRLAAGLLLAAAVLAAHADALRYRLSGTTGPLSDTAGVLGAPAPGTPFQLDFVADFSVGLRGGGVGGFGSSNWLIGGSSYEASPFYPTIQTSPVRAVLTVGSHQLLFAGDYSGTVQYTQNWFDEQFGGDSHSWADLLAQSGNADALQSSVSATLSSPFSAGVFGSIETLGALAVDGSRITGSASFSYGVGAAAVSGSLSPSAFAVDAVPEPASWVLMAAGGAVLLAAVRRRLSSAA